MHHVVIYYGLCAIYLEHLNTQTKCACCAIKHTSAAGKPVITPVCIIRLKRSLKTAEFYTIFTVCFWFIWRLYKKFILFFCSKLIDGYMH